MIPSRNILISLIALISLTGCRAKPAPDAGFLKDTQLMKKEKDVPYNRIYLSRKFQEKNYTELYVAPVDTQHIMKENGWEILGEAHLIKDDVHKNVRMLSEYTQDAFIKAAQKDPSRHFVIVPKPGPHTLILETAIVQLVPSKALLNAASYVSWIPTIIMFAAPVATNSEDGGKGVIAMEARLRDGGTGEIVAMFADREHPPTAIIDVKSLFWWEPAKPIIDGWARQFVLLMNGVRGKKNKEISNFEIIVL